MNLIIITTVFQFAAIITGMGCVTGIVITFLKRRGKAFSTPEMMARLNEISERLARLENSTDATAVEVERISEAQRFTAKVLAERANPPRVGERKSVTPH